MNIFKRPMFLPACICCVAAAISLFAKWLVFIIFLVLLILLLIAVFNKKHKCIIVLFAVFIFIISLVIQFIKIEQINTYNGKTINGTFVVLQEPTNYEQYNSVALKALSSGAVSKNTKLLVFDYQKHSLKAGQIVKANLKINAIARNNKYRLYDYGNGIYATASAKKIKITNNKNFLHSIAGNIRKYVKKTISTNFSGDTSGLLLAITTGDKTLLSKAFSNNIKTTGISHIIVVSGMHISIIMSAIFWCIDKFFYNKYIRAFLSIAVILLICYVCGFTMSIIRAGAMFVIAGLAPVFNRENDSLNSLLTAVICVLIASPFAIFNVSFQLSVLSTLAIIWVVPFYYNAIVIRFKMSSKILKLILNIVLCSSFAMIFTLPIVIKIFGYASIVSPITNLLITYPITIVLVINIIAICLSAIPVINFLSYPMFFLTKLLSNFIIFVVNNIAKLPITVAVLPKSAFLGSIILIILVISYMYFYKFKKKRSDFSANII